MVGPKNIGVVRYLLQPGYQLTRKEELAQAAFERDWRKVSWLQDKLLNSWPAKVLAVKEVADADSVPGVDGVLWITDVQFQITLQVGAGIEHRPSLTAKK